MWWSPGCRCCTMGYHQRMVWRVLKNCLIPWGSWFSGIGGAAGTASEWCEVQFHFPLVVGYTVPSPLQNCTSVHLVTSPFQRRESDSWLSWMLEWACDAEAHPSGGFRRKTSERLDAAELVQWPQTASVLRPPPPGPPSLLPPSWRELAFLEPWKGVSKAGTKTEMSLCLDCSPHLTKLFGMARLCGFNEPCCHSHNPDVRKQTSLRCCNLLTRRDQLLYYAWSINDSKCRIGISGS